MRQTLSIILMRLIVKNINLCKWNKFKNIHKHEKQLKNNWKKSYSEYQTACWFKTFMKVYLDINIRKMCKKFTTNTLNWEHFTQFLTLELKQLYYIKEKSQYLDKTYLKETHMQWASRIFSPFIMRLFFVYSKFQLHLF